MQPPRVLVLLAAFNGMAYLPAQLASILCQQAVAVQVVLSIDRSSDGTEAWAAQFAQRDARVSVLPGGQVFGGAAPNFFRLLRDVNLAGFDYVAMSDQDDLWHPDKLARACQQLQHTGAVGYSGNVTAFWPNGKERLIDKAQPQQPWDFLFEAPGPGCTFVLAQPLALALQTWVRQQGSALQPVDFHDWLIYAWARARGAMPRWPRRRSAALRRCSASTRSAAMTSRCMTAARWRCCPMPAWYLKRSALPPTRCRCC